GTVMNEVTQYRYRDNDHSRSRIDQKLHHYRAVDLHWYCIDAATRSQRYFRGAERDGQLADKYNENGQRYQLVPHGCSPVRYLVGIANTEIAFRFYNWLAKSP